MTETEFRTIRYERDADIGMLTLARPEKRNAQNPLMWQELRTLGTALAGDDSLRCLVVTGDGSSFSAGIDLVEGLAGFLGDVSDRPESDLKIGPDLGAPATFAWIPALGCPSIAAVNGHAYGAGLQLALACDFRFFGRSAQVGLLEMRYGLMPDMGATVRLPRIIGEARARELILLADGVGADEALRIGLANRVVEDEELMSATSDLARRLASQPPVAIRGARRALEASWHQDPHEGLRVAVEAQIACIRSEDFKEAGRAQAEGRKPVWQGR